MPMTVDLEGQVALVTGAGRNIGRAIAETLAANGATVVFTDARAQDAEAAAAEVPGAIALGLDVRDEEAVERAVATVERRCGKLDLLVNNAGINTGKRVTVDEFPREEWDKILAVDITGLYLVSRAAARIMRRQRRGRIVNISSVVGVVPLRLQCAFAAAKAGVNNLTRAMAVELGKDGILVNAIAPGSILTEGTRQLFYGSGDKPGEMASRMLSHVPLGRPGECADIAGSVLFLAAPESAYITGQVLCVDGGWTAGYTRDF
jgi:NAD(P)-dependent dehydrogenase (short-subunit alcohol dehydrogenase family)